MTFGSLSTNFLVHEQLVTVLRGFTSVGPAPATKTISLRIALAQSDKDGLVDALYSVSNPKSAKYGQYLSKVEVEAFVAPSPATQDALNARLEDSGLNATSISPAGDWIGIDILVSKANSLFDADFATFEHQSSGKQVVRTLSYSLSEALQGDVDLVHPTINFLKPFDVALPKTKRAFHEIVPKKRDEERDVTSTCGNGTIPACVHDLYQILATPATNKTNSLGVTGLFGNNAHYAFLEKFLQTYRPDMDPTTNFTVVGIDGGVNDQNGSSVSEGEADIQYTVGVATNVNVTYYFIGPDVDDDPTGGFIDEANLLLSLENPPLVLTTSYADSESGLSFDLTDSVRAAQRAGMFRGRQRRVRVDVPVHLPLRHLTQSLIPEEVWSGFFGGFLIYHPTPDHQAAVGSAYIAAHERKNAERFNASGRAFPDIAAKVDHFFVLEPDGRKRRKPDSGEHYQ
ncbi:Pro-kumamolisin, activation domain-containing protein [Dichomitus squalens]|uniref:Pro-kumamolisin, activation domain-containing protein n=1 Tax=Dichomitus squalens TaxID=114155 RepID=A0A4Q9MIR3_9APHY|nr:Pro-kumamolisin, activation domain-containing protein [Dichomitus squalens]